jgi:class 3 adenylate cyclase
VKALLLVLAFTTAVAAADDKTYVFTGEELPAHKKVMVLPDLDGKLDINAVMSPKNAARFVPAPSINEKDIEPGTYWLRITLENPLPASRTLALFPVAAWREFRVYSGADPAKSGRSGLEVPIGERDLEVTRRAWGLIPYMATRAELPAAATTTFYIRATSDWHYVKPDGFMLSVADLAEILAEERQIRGALLFFFGTLVALSLYHLILFFGLRDRGSAYYVLHVTASAMIAPTFYGLAAEIFFPTHPGWALVALVYWKGLLAIGLLMFARVYLDTRKNHRLLDKAILAFSAANAVIMLGSPFGNYELNNVFIAIPSLGAFLLAFGVGVAAMLKGNPAARYFVAANAFNLLGITVAMFGEFQVILGPTIGGFATPIGTTLEAILLSRGLAYRMNMLKAELAEQRLAEERLRRQQEEDRRRFLEQQSDVLERTVAERTAELSAERERSESLLRNILPDSVAEELKRDGRSTPRRHEEVSILFTDFAQFTQTMSTLPPARMVEELNEIFHGFDEIVGRHGLEKIKTIGDAYMAAAGVPVAQDDHALRCARAALDMQRWMAARNEHASLKWGLRVGVHSGAVVAGVVGRKKYAYDIWGDTVNIASRMESSGSPGRINVSAYTYDLIRWRFECEYRGKIEAKGKGAIDMYFLVQEKVGAVATEVV